MSWYDARATAGAKVDMVLVGIQSGSKERMGFSPRRILTPTNMFFDLLQADRP